MRDSPILVTGGAGFIGSALVRHLVRDRGERVDAIDGSATRAALGWSPRVPFERGIADTVRWDPEHEAWCDDVPAGRYDGERLGLALAGAAR